MAGVDETGTHDKRMITKTAPQRDWHLPHNANTTRNQNKTNKKENSARGIDVDA